MTLDDQIKYEKLQYDINRKAAKISALSSGKFNKYEYFTSEELLPSNNQQIIEQAKFEYSPLGNAFEKQVKTIEDQGKKQIKALENLKLKEITQKEIKSDGAYNNYFIKELAKIQKSIEPVDFNDVTYYFKDIKIAPISFVDFKGLMHISKSIHNGNATLEDIEKEQKKLKKN